MATPNLLDIAKRTGSDTAVGLVEEVVTYAPELQTLPVRPIAGTSFKTTVRTGYPTAAFRAANEGLAIQKSTYEQKLQECFYIDTQLKVDKAVADADDMSLGDYLAQEAAGAMQGTGIAIGSQFYYGTSSDAKGFTGLLANYDSTNMLVDATGGASSTSVYFVWENIKGVHLVAGRNAAIDFGFAGEWPVQQVLDGSSNSYMAYVNNVSGYIGLAFGNKYSVCRIREITAGAPLTDALGAQALSKFPVYIRNSGQLRCFMNRTAAYLLQLSRSSVGYTTAGPTGMGAFAPLPTEICGVPITITDSLVNTEADNT